VKKELEETYLSKKDEFEIIMEEEVAKQENRGKILKIDRI
jgi:hypothetical protein